VRGCLFVVVLGGTLLAAVAWFAPGPLAGAVIGAVLDGSGYRATSTTITANAEPPPRLLLGHADELTIDGTDVTWRGLRARRLRVTLVDVDLLARTARSVDGRIEGAELSDAVAGTATGATIDVRGAAAAAPTTIRVDAATVRSLVATAVERAFAVRPDDVQLAPPATLRLVTPGATIEGTLVVTERELQLSTRLGPVTMVRIDPAVPLTLRSVGVADGGLRIEGVLDAVALLGG